MLLAQATPAERKPSATDEAAATDSTVKVPRPRDSARPPRRTGVVPAARRAAEPAPASAPAPAPGSAEKKPVPTPAPAAETSDRRRPPPAQRPQGTGAGTMNRGATGADQPMNNVDPPSRNNRPVRSTDERAPAPQGGASQR